MLMGNEIYKTIKIWLEKFILVLVNYYTKCRHCAVNGCCPKSRSFFVCFFKFLPVVSIIYCWIIEH